MHGGDTPRQRRQRCHGKRQVSLHIVCLLDQLRGKPEVERWKITARYSSYLSRADADELTISLIAKEGQSTGMTSWMGDLGHVQSLQWLVLVEFGRWSRGGGMHLPSLISTSFSQLPKAAWCTEHSVARVFPVLHTPACLNIAAWLDKPRQVKHWCRVI